MSKLTYISANGGEHTVEVANGTNAMDAALQNLVPGIDGDCGGTTACGTCHVYVPPEWQEKLGGPSSEAEQAMLALTDNARSNSRLACQIKMTPELDGLVLMVPAAQH